MTLTILISGLIAFSNPVNCPDPTLPDDRGRSGWTERETSIICTPDSTLRVLTLDSREDSLLLRQTCVDLPEEAIRSEEYGMLASKMIATVTDPSQDGVGIAGPQVGILRRIVAVQRFDKEGEPFEVYPNIRITVLRGEKEPGREGCLSVPEGFVPGSEEGHAEVMRYRDIDITYYSLRSGRDTTETVRGFTAVIFQHECDHLDGKLFIDYLQQ